jgi:L-lactate dehydrogenase complex protein LldG
MTDNNAAKTAILQRIRSANGEKQLQPAAEDWLRIPRNYNRQATHTKLDVSSLLMDRLVDYDAEVERVSPLNLKGTIGRVLSDRNHPRMLVAKGFPKDLLPEGDWIYDDGFSPAELDLFDGILTTSTLAIAQTGTLVLQNVPGQGRRASTLVPDFHLCILESKNVVETVPEALDRLALSAHLPTTFVSGPSATADIEMTRIKGVHGPRFLHVILAED